MTDTLKDIPVFVAAVEAGSFAQAAIRLPFSRSAVGQRIALPEGGLGGRPRFFTQLTLAAKKEVNGTRLAGERVKHKKQKM